MRKLLNTLFITSPDSYLTKEGENVVITVDGEKKLQLPIHTLEGIICFGYAGASPSLMHMCATKGVGLAFHNEYGKFLARISGPVQGNVLLRKKQYKAADDIAYQLSVAKNCITGKILNSRNILQRAIRDHKNEVNCEELETTINRLQMSLNNIEDANNIDSLRGIEGEASKWYFGVLDELILHQKDDFYMDSRNKRPPRDNFNALLSFLYTMLAHDVQSALEAVGLDPYVGFMHQDRPGRASLALDLMEELRPCLADRLAISLINRKQITARDFIVKENEAVLMDKDTRKIVLENMHNRKKEEIVHPFLNEKIPVGLIPYSQALLLARFLRGDIDAYPPFVWR
jgi:CRISPR-associated protein Cas1